MTITPQGYSKVGPREGHRQEVGAPPPSDNPRRAPARRTISGLLAGGPGGIGRNRT